jgi:hypothetical protein
MADFAAQYEHFNDDELLQLSTENAQLVPDARQALNEEIRRRGLVGESSERSTATRKEPTKRLDPPIETYINLSVLWFWLRELWLRSRTSQGISTNATVESTRRTRPGYRSAARAELRYSYHFQGTQYTGRTVRDFLFNSAAAESLTEHRYGQIIAVLVDPNHPERSYYPSGFGWVEPLIMGIFASLVWLLLLLIVFGKMFKL